VDHLLLDARYAFRRWRRQPGASIVALITLSLAIGVATAVVAVIDATMLRPLPYPRAEELVTLSVEEAESGGTYWRPSPSMQDLIGWQSARDVFVTVSAAGQVAGGRIVDGLDPVRVRVASFTENYLPMHGVSPVVGRGFLPTDTVEGAPTVVLLGYGFWQSRYAGSPDAVGRMIRLDGNNALIVGVLPPWFNRTVPLSIPLKVQSKDFSRRGTGRFAVYARLRPELTIEQARERLVGRLPARTHDHSDRTVVISRLESTRAGYKAAVRVLCFVSGLILLIAATNVGGLLLAQGTSRQSELALRAVVGAGRARITRQLLTENVILALCSLVLGLFLAWLAIDAIIAIIPITLPANARVTLNPTVIVLTSSVLLFTSLLFCLLPAVRVSQVNVASALSRINRQVSSSLSRRTGQVLIGVEIALAVMVAAAAGLAIRSFERITSVEMGFNRRGVLTMQLLPLDRSPAARMTYYEALVARLRTIPDIASVGLVDNFVLGSGSTSTAVVASGRATDVMCFSITPGYLETIGVNVRAGRLPTNSDHSPGLQAAVINEAAARVLFPDQIALGQELLRAGQFGRPWVVQAVIADLMHGGPVDNSPGVPVVFFQLRVSDVALNSAMTVAVRAAANNAAIGNVLREVAKGLGQPVLIESIRSADDWFSEAVVTPRRQAALLGTIAALGLTLALAGVFGITAYVVGRRQGEIGIRLALGARRGQVFTKILGEAVLPIAVGTTIGLASTGLTARLMQSFLFRTSPADALTLAVVGIAFLMSGCLAAFVPVYLAARVDPASSLRGQ
jgi:putative ABC transport system permease protein